MNATDMLIRQTPQEFIENMAQRLVDQRAERAAKYFAAARVLTEHQDLKGMIALTNLARIEDEALEVSSGELDSAKKNRGISLGAVYDFGRYLDMHLRFNDFAPAARMILSNLIAEVDVYMKAQETAGD